jgi:spermidine synthase
MKRTFSLFFFLSGVSGLVFQLLWSRKFGELLGNSYLSISIVVAVFMLGLFTGAWVIGKRIHRVRNELKLYAVLEFSIGLYVILFVAAFGPIREVFLAAFRLSSDYPFAYQSLKLLLTAILLIPPTAAMGATLPLLVRFFSRGGDAFGGNISHFYMVNTLGAAIGTLLAGFLLLEFAGVDAGLLIAAGLNLIAGAGAFLSQRNLRPVFPEKAATGIPAKKAGLIFLAASLGTGFSALAMEMIWTRGLKFLVHSSTYSFASVLFIFLIGITLGSRLVKKIQVPEGRKLYIFGLLQLLIAIYSLFSLFFLYSFAESGLFEQSVSSVLYDFGIPWGWTIPVYLGVTALVMLIPCVAMGASFPMLNDLYFQHTATDAGETVSRVYAVNTIGGIAGSLAAGYFLIPVLGLKVAMLCTVVLSAGIGFYFVFRSADRPWLSALVAAFLFLGAGALAWQDPYLSGRGERPSDKVLFYQEGLMSTVKVFDQGNTRSMSIDGRVIASTGPALLQKERMIAHLPFFLKREIRRVLSVGLASGISTGSMTLHPEVEQIDCVELIRPVFAASSYFSDYNHRIDRQPGVRLIQEDVLSFLQTNTDRYDLISSDGKLGSLNKGNTVMLSRDYYDICHDRLSPGGLFIQWVPLITPDTIMQVILQTLHTVFPEIGLFYFYPSDLFMVASDRRIQLDKTLIDELLARADLKKELTETGFQRSAALFAAYAGHYIPEPNPPPVNSFDHPILEFWYLREWKKGSQIPGGYRAANMEYLIRNLESGKTRAAGSFSGLGNPLYAQAMVNSTLEFMAFCRQNFIYGSPEAGQLEYEKFIRQIPF